MKVPSYSFSIIYYELKMQRIWSWVGSAWATGLLPSLYILFLFITVNLQSKNHNFPGSSCHCAQCKAVVWICFCCGTCRANMFHRNLVWFTRVQFTRSLWKEWTNMLRSKENKQTNKTKLWLQILYDNSPFVFLVRELLFNVLIE